jgi:hypothetical protein
MGARDVLPRGPRGSHSGLACRGAVASPPDEGETESREVETAQRYDFDAPYNGETTAQALPLKEFRRSRHQIRCCPSTDRYLEVCADSLRLPD